MSWVHLWLSFCLSVVESKQAGSSGGQLGRAASCRPGTRRGRHAEPHRHHKTTKARRDHRSAHLPKLAAAPKLPARPTEAARLEAEAACPAAEAACRCFFNRDPEGMRGTFRSHKNLHVRETRLAAGRRTERTNEASRRRRELPAPPPKSSARVGFV